jgi:hypothetical protein
MKLSGSAVREERLRMGRGVARTVRDASPGVALVNVSLQFLPATAPLHAAQSFVLYPGARAYFAYPCPYGDCDGVYDLGAEAGLILKRERARVTGTVECRGVRSRGVLQRQPCGLCVSYTITAQQAPEAVR